MSSTPGKPAITTGDNYHSEPAAGGQLRSLTARQKAIFDNYGFHFTDGYYYEFDTINLEGQVCRKSLQLSLRLNGELRNEGQLLFDDVKGQASYELLEQFVDAATSCLNGGLPVAALQSVVAALSDFGITRLFDESTGTLIAHWQASGAVNVSERFSLLMPPTAQDLEPVVLDWYPGQNLFETPLSMWTALNSDDAAEEIDEEGD